MWQLIWENIFMCVKDLCFSNIPSKSDRYKYYCHRFSLGKCLREIKRKFSTTSIVWPFDLHAVITKSQFICSISVQGRLSVYRQSLLSPFMSFFGNEKMGKWRKVVKLPLFACKARDNWEARFVTCPIARMPYTNNIFIIPFLDLCVSFEAFWSTKLDITIAISKWSHISLIGE